VLLILFQVYAASRRMPARWRIVLQASSLILALATLAYCGLIIYGLLAVSGRL